MGMDLVGVTTRLGPKDLLPWRGISFLRIYTCIRLISRLLKCTPPLPDSLDLFLRLLERGRDTFAIGIYIYIYFLIKRACSSWHAAITATKIRYEYPRVRIIRGIDTTHSMYTNKFGERIFHLRGILTSPRVFFFFYLNNLVPKIPGKETQFAARYIHCYRAKIFFLCEKDERKTKENNNNNI